MCCLLQADNIQKLTAAANVKVEPYWPGLFAKLFANKSMDDLITNVGAGKRTTKSHVDAIVCWLYQHPVDSLHSSKLDWHNLLLTGGGGAISSGGGGGGGAAAEAGGAADKEEEKKDEPEEESDEVLLLPCLVAFHACLSEECLQNNLTGTNCTASSCDLQFSCALLYMSVLDACRSNRA